jgi:heme exporter protein C
MSRQSIAGSGTRNSRRLGAVTLALTGVSLLLALVISPNDEVQKNAVRLLYVHVGLISAAYLCFMVCGLCSVMWLWKRTRIASWDRVAGAAGEVGTVLLAVFLFTGMLWGHLTWNVWWTWDPRLTTTALLFIIMCGYLSVRSLDGSMEARAKRSAIVALIGVAQIPIINQSVNWWRTLHQTSTFQQRNIDMDGVMLLTTFLSVLACIMIAGWLILHRARVAWLETQLDEVLLASAIDARRVDARSVAHSDVAAQS